MCDSTNAIRDGVSPSEADVAVTLTRLIGEARQRVAVTTFASNVARIRSVAKATRAAGRELVVVGRAMYRVIEAAQATGYLDPDLAVSRGASFRQAPAPTGRGALHRQPGRVRAPPWRASPQDEHPNVKLDPGDRVIFSSRTIPGNEKAVGARAERPRRSRHRGHHRPATRRCMCRAIRGAASSSSSTAGCSPKIAIPMHGEGTASRGAGQARRDARRARGRSARGTARWCGSRLAPAAIIDDVPVGRLYRDGAIITRAADGQVRERRKLSFAGAVSLCRWCCRTRGCCSPIPKWPLSGFRPPTRKAAC